jgi:hypothetical protein
MKFKKLGYIALIAATALAFVLGSAATGEAKAKKTTVEPQPQSFFCPWMSRPVCAVTHGMKFTYDNACWALKDGATVVASHACANSALSR